MIRRTLTSAGQDPPHRLRVPATAPLGRQALGEVLVCGPRCLGLLPGGLAKREELSRTAEWRKIEQPEESGMLKQSCRSVLIESRR